MYRNYAKNGRILLTFVQILGLFSRGEREWHLGVWERERDNSIPEVWEREGNGKKPFPKFGNKKEWKKAFPIFGNGKGMKKSIPKIWER